jgi:hypothetical protein
VDTMKIAVFWNVTPLILYIFTDISEELSASIFMIEGLLDIRLHGVTSQKIIFIFIRALGKYKLLRLYLTL